MYGVMALLIYFSFSAKYGENIYIYLVLLKVLGIIFENLTDVIFIEPILRNGITCLVSLGISFSTLSANDFYEFLFSSFVEGGMMIVERLYMSQLIDYGIE